jgi:zinc transporter, ZIP family
LIGLYVGVIPVVLGLMWHPFMRGLSRSTMDAILALTIGLLIFLGIETAKEGLEIAARVPHPFSGHVLFYLLIQIVGSRRAPERGVAAGRLMVSYLLALGIGLHNLAEGFTIGAAYAAGQAGLGAFLVVASRCITSLKALASPRPSPKTIPVCLLSLDSHSSAGRRPLSVPGSADLSIATSLQQCSWASAWEQSCK